VGSGTTPHRHQAGSPAGHWQSGAGLEDSALYHKRTDCRACGESTLRLFLTLGPQPLANAFLRSPDDFAAERWFPLDVYFCETCSLVQLADVIHPEVLFREYIYVSGTSTTLAEHHRRYARSVTDMLGLTPRDLVVEIASNDGNLLKEFRALGVRTLGVEPARNIAEMARAAGIDTVDRFFDHRTAVELREQYGGAQAVVGNNVLAHVDETRDFLRGCAALVADEGLVVIEVPYVRDMVEHLEYDTIYHEHHCYFSVTNLARLGEEVGLELVRVDRVPIHGGSIRVHYRRQRGAGHDEQPRAIMAEERALGLTSFETFQQYARRVEANRREIRLLLESLRGQGKSVAAYGAPAKGNTLTNYCQLDTELVPFTVDKNPLKIGTYTPGMHIPVLPASTLVERRPDYVLILAWNFAEEIMTQQLRYRELGGRFIVPIPSPRII
jgi:hypothetical protein